MLKKLCTHFLTNFNNINYYFCTKAQNKPKLMGAILKSISQRKKAKISNSKFNLSRSKLDKLDSLLIKERFEWRGSTEKEYKENSIPSYKNYLLH